MTDAPSSSTVRTIETLNQCLSKRLKRIDERKLNDLFDTIPNIDLEQIVRKKLPELSKSRERKIKPLTPVLRRIVRDLALLDEPDRRRRLKIFIGYCRYKNYTYNTTMAYFRTLRSNGLFGSLQADDSTLLLPSKFAFVDSGKPHIRSVSMQSFVKLSKHLHDNFTRFNAPLLIAIYTALRTFEILQFTALTLHQLELKHKYVSISRKQTVATTETSEPEFWRPIYSTRFTRFVNQLLHLYRPEYENYRDAGINVKLFYVTPNTLVTRIRAAFFEANGFAAPRGFGIHSCRNMISMLMAQSTENVSAIQAFLQHRNVQTTRKYIHADFSHVSKEFDRLTNYEFANVRRNMDCCAESEAEK